MCLSIAHNNFIQRTLLHSKVEFQKSRLCRAADATALGGEARFSRRAAFVTENWIFPGVDQPLISYGIHFFGEAISVDLALINTLGKGMPFPGFPYIDFVYNF